MKRVIITGPTGAIGLALIKNLIAKGVAVTAVCRPGSKRNVALSSIPGVDLVECDLAMLLEPGSMRDKLPKDRYDVFYHLAWAGTTGDSRNDMLLQLKNIQYTLDAVVLAKRLGCRRFIGAGSQAEYGRTEEVLMPHTPCHPENGYGIAKLAAGQMSRLLCKKLQMEHVWTRVLSVYGPGDTENSLISQLIRELMAGNSPHCTKGEQVWDYLFSEDASEIFCRLGDAEHVNGCIFPVGSGRREHLKTYMETVRAVIGDHTGKEAPKILYDRPYAAGQVMHLITDITELSEVIGYVPETEFSDGIRKILQRRETG